MPYGCVNFYVLGTTSIVGGGGCGLPGTYTKISGLIPPAPFTTQNTLPTIRVAQSG